MVVSPSRESVKPYEGMPAALQNNLFSERVFSTRTCKHPLSLAGKQAFKREAETTGNQVSQHQFCLRAFDDFDVGAGNGDVAAIGELGVEDAHEGFGFHLNQFGGQGGDIGEQAEVGFADDANRCADAQPSH